MIYCSTSQPLEGAPIIPNHSLVLSAGSLSQLLIRFITSAIKFIPMESPFLVVRQLRQNSGFVSSRKKSHGRVNPTFAGFGFDFGLDSSKLCCLYVRTKGTLQKHGFRFSEDITPTRHTYSLQLSAVTPAEHERTGTFMVLVDLHQCEQ